MVGFWTIDGITKLISSVFFGPVAAGALVLPIVWTADRDSLKRKPLATITETWQGVAGASLVALNLASLLNRYASWYALNNGVRDTFKGTSEELIVVTGGSSGLGAQIAQQFAALGYRVAVLDVQELTFTAPPGVSFFRCDLSKPADIASACAQIKEKLGNPTALINNAGVARLSSVTTATTRDIDLTYDINVKAHFYTVQAFLPAMIASNHGHIVTVASAAAYVSACEGVAYCSSKAAALSFHEGLSLELAVLSPASKVRTSIVCPGHIKTDLFAGFYIAPNFFSPSLEPKWLASRIVKVILSGSSQIILEPQSSRNAPAGRALPSWLFKHILWSAKDSMRQVNATKAAMGLKTKD